MAKITLNPISGMYASVSAINARLQQIEDAMNNNILWRDGFTGEPNQMEADFDMNGYSILNFLVDQATVGAEFSTVRATNIYQDDVRVTDLSDQSWLGGFPANPTHRNDGTTPVQEGDAYYNTVDGFSRTFDGAGWNILTATSASTADSVSVADTSGHFITSPKNVETVLEEVGAKLNPLPSAIAANTTSIGINEGDITTLEGRATVNETDIDALEAWQASLFERGWDINEMREPAGTYDFSGTVSTSFSCFCLSNDGTILYVLKNSNKTVYQFDLSTPFKISTASPAGSKDLSTISGLTSISPDSIFVNPTGSRMYIADEASRYVKQLTMAGGQVSSLGWTSGHEFYYGGELNWSNTLTIDSTGTYLALVKNDITGDDMIIYEFTTPWDVTGGVSYSSSRSWFSVSGYVNNIKGAYLHPDSVSFTVALDDDYVITRDSKHTFWTDFDYTNSNTTTIMSVASDVTTNAHGVQFLSDGCYVYVGDTSRKIHQYDIGRIFKGPL